MIELLLRLPSATSGLISTARHSVRTLTGHIPEALQEDLELLVSELVTNSVRHGELGPAGWVELRVLAWRDRVQVEVADSGAGFTPGPIGDLQLGEHTGWGLYLLHRLATEWGVGRDGDGDADGGAAKVWFVLEHRVDLAGA